MIAIHTKYIAPSSTKGARIKAYTNSRFSAVVSYPYEKSTEVAHYEAVKALAEKYNLSWSIDAMCFGDSADGKGYTFCFNQSKIAA